MDYSLVKLIVEALSGIDTRLEEIRDQLMIANGAVPPQAPKPEEAR